LCKKGGGGSGGKKGRGEISQGSGKRRDLSGEGDKLQKVGAEVCEKGRNSSRNTQRGVVTSKKVDSRKARQGWELFYLGR